MQKEKLPLNNLGEAQANLKNALDSLSLPGELDVGNIASNLSRYFADFCSKPIPPKISTYPLEGCSSLIIQRDLPFFSYCPHHLLPVHGAVDIAYSPSSTVMSLGSFKRIVHYFEYFPLLQEQATYNIAKLLQETLQPQGVWVKMRLFHTCSRTTLETIERFGTIRLP